MEDLDLSTIAGVVASATPETEPQPTSLPEITEAARTSGRADELDIAAMAALGEKEYGRAMRPGPLTEIGRGFGAGMSTVAQGYYGVKALYNRSELFGEPDIAGYNEAIADLRETQRAGAIGGPSFQNISDVETIDDAVYFLLGGVPQLIPFATGVGGAAMVGAKIGSAVATKIALKTLKAKVQKKVAAKMGEAATEKLNADMTKRAAALAQRTIAIKTPALVKGAGASGYNAGQAVGAYIASAGMETGFIYGDYTAEGVQDVGPALAYGSASGLLGSMGSVYLLRKMFGKHGLKLPKAKIKVAKKKVAKIMKIAKTMGVEGSTEVMQESMAIAANREATGKTGPLTKEEKDQLLNAGVLGALGSGILVGAAGATKKAIQAAPEAAAALKQRQARLQAKEDARQTVSEATEMFDAQLAAVKDGRKPAIFIPTVDLTNGSGRHVKAMNEIEGSIGYPAPDGSGIFVFNDPATEELITAGRLGSALGYGVEEKSGDGSTVVTPYDAEGRPIHDIAVDQNDKEAMTLAMKEAKRVAGKGGTVKVRTAQEAMADRVKGAKHMKAGDLEEDYPGYGQDRFEEPAYPDEFQDWAPDETRRPTRPEVTVLPPGPDAREPVLQGAQGSTRNVPEAAGMPPREPSSMDPGEALQEKIRLQREGQEDEVPEFGAYSVKDGVGLKNRDKPFRNAPSLSQNEDDWTRIEHFAWNDPDLAAQYPHDDYDRKFVEGPDGWTVKVEIREGKGLSAEALEARITEQRMGTGPEQTGVTTESQIRQKIIHTQAAATKKTDAEIKSGSKRGAKFPNPEHIEVTGKSGRPLYLHLPSIVTLGHMILQSNPNRSGVRSGKDAQKTLNAYSTGLVDVYMAIEPYLKDPAEFWAIADPDTRTNKYVGYKVLAKRGPEQGGRPVTINELQRDSSKALKKALDRERSIRNSEQKIEDDIARIQEKDGLTHADAKAKANKELVAENREGAQSAKELGPVSAPAKDKIGLNVAREGRIEFLEKRIKLEREGRALPDEANLKKDRIAAWQAELDMLNDLAAEENLSSHTNLVNSVAMSEAGSAAEISEIYRQIEELKRVPLENDRDIEQIAKLEQQLIDISGVPAPIDAAQIMQRELDRTRVDRPKWKAMQRRVGDEVSKAKRNAAESALFGFPEGGIESVDQMVEGAEASSLPQVDPETRQTVQKPLLKTTRSSAGVTTIMAGPWDGKLTALVRHLRKLLGIPEEIVIMDRAAFEQVYGPQDNKTYNGSGGMTILPQRKGEPVIIVMHNEMVNKNLASGLMAIGHEMGHVAYEAYIKGMSKAVRAQLESEWRADLDRTERTEADHSFEEWMSDQMSHWVNKFLTDEAWMKANKIAAVKQNVRARAYEGIPGFFRGFIKQLLEISDAVRSYAGGIIAARTTRSDAYADFMQQIMASVAARDAAVKVFAEQGGLESAQVNDPAYSNLIKGLREAARAEARKVFQAKANSGGMILPSPILARPGADPKYMNLDAARRGAEALTTSVQNGSMAEGLGKWFDTAMRNASLFLRGADKVLRDLPGGDAVADHFNVQAGKVASATQKAMGNYWDESRLEMARWMGKVDAIFTDGPAGFDLLDSLPLTSRTARRSVKKAIQERQAAAARDMIQEGGPTTAEGKALRAVLNKFQEDTRTQQLQHRAPIQYRNGQFTDDHRSTDASVVGYIENFFPHMWSPSVLDTAQGRADFDRLMDQYVQPDYVGQEWLAFKDEIFRGLVDGEGFDMATGTDAGGVSSLQWSGGKQRTLNIPTQELIDAGLIMFDKGEFGVEGVLESYFKQATRALQWEKRFGGYVRFDPETAPPPGVRQHDRIGKLDIERNRDRANVNRAPGEDIFFWDPSKKLNDYITTLPSEDARIRATTILNAYAGRLGNDLSPGMKVAAEAFMMVTNIIILPLAVFAQFADIGVMYQRSGDLRATLKVVMDSSKEWGKDNQGEMGRYAKQAGIIVDRELQNIMIETSEMGGRSRGARWLNNTRKAHNAFFHLNGMEGFTSMMRRAAASLGSEYMVNHAQIIFDENSTEAQRGSSAERLAELGVDPQAVLDWDAAGRPTDNRELMRGLNIFVDEAAMRPTAARRPALISHPVIGMLQHLHQFMYIYNTQVLDRFKNMYVYGSSEAPMESFKAVARLLPSALGLAMLGYMMRTMLYGLGDDDDKDRSLSFMDAVDKAGLLGTWQLGYDWVRNDYNKGFLDNSLYTLMGGGPSLFTKFITSSPASATAGFVPNIPGGRGFKKSVKEAIGG